MTNCELLRWLVEMPSRDVHHYRMMNVSAVDHDLFISMMYGHVLRPRATLSTSAYHI